MEKRKFLSVMFECCNVYARIYVNKDNTAYVGYCPKCYKRVNIPIGPGGTSCRSFRVS